MSTSPVTPVIWMRTSEMIENHQYKLTRYKYLHGNCGYFYVIFLTDLSDNTLKRAHIRDGIIFDYLEDLRKTPPNPIPIIIIQRKSYNYYDDIIFYYSINDSDSSVFLSA